MVLILCTAWDRRVSKNFDGGKPDVIIKKLKFAKTQKIITPEFLQTFRGVTVSE